MRLKTKIFIGFVSAFIITIVMGYVSYRSAQDTIKDNLKRRDINNFIKKIKQLSSDFYECEALEGYFVLSYDKKYVSELSTYNKKLNGDLDELNKIKYNVLEDDLLKNSFEKLYSAMKSEIMDDDQRISFFRLHDSIEVVKNYDVNEHNEVIKKIGGFMDELGEKLEQIRSGLNDKAQNEAGVTRIILISGTVLALLIVIISFLIISLDISGREKAERDLKKLNEELEKKISERTKHLTFLNNKLSKEIEEKEQSEKLLRESEEQYRSLFENMSEGYAYCKMIYDKEEKPYDWIYIDINESFERLTGLKNAKRKLVSEVIPNIRATDPKLFEIYSRVSQSGVPEKFEMFVESLKMWFSISVYSPQKEYFVAVFDVITERKKAEETLRESENKFNIAFRSSPIAMVISSLEDKTYIDVNDIFIKSSGFNREEVLGHTSEQLNVFVHKGDRDKLLSEVLKNGHVYAKETDLRMKSGQILNCLISMSVIQMSGKPYLLTSIVNVTEHKLMENSVHESEAKLSNAMRLAQLGHWEFDVASGLFTFNDHFYAIYRTTAEQVGGYKMTPQEYAERFVHPDDKDMVGIEVRKSLESIGPEFSGQVEHRIIYGDGKTGYISVRYYSVKDSNGKSIKNIGVNQDITERKLAEEKLHEQHVLLQTLMDESPDLIYIKDKRNKFIMASNSVAEFMGTTRDNLIGKTDMEFYPKELTEKFISDEKQIIETGKALINSEEPRLNPDGSKTWILTTKVPLLNKKGDVTGLLGISRDISKIKIDEEKIKGLNRVYAVLSNINGAIVRISDKKKLLDEICKIIVEDGGTSLAWIGFIDEGINKVIPYSFYGCNNGYLDNIDISTLDVPEGRGPVGTSIREDKYIFINDIKNDSRMEPWKKAALSRGYNSVCSFPLKVKSKTIGAISIYAAEKNYFDHEEIKLLDELSSDISFALETIETKEIQKIAEKKLQENELILKALVNNIPESVLLINKEGEILYANDTVAERFKKTQDELIGFNTFNLDERNVAEERKEYILNALKNKKPVRFQDKRNGKIIYNYINPVLDSRGEVNNLAILGVDMTDRLKAEEEIIKSEQLFRLHVDNTPLGVIEWDTNFCVKRWNESAERIFGYTKEEAIGMHASVIVPDEAKKHVDKAWDELLNNKGGFRSTNANINKCGNLMTCSWYNTPLVDKEGKVFGVASLVDDITDKVKSDNALKETLDEKELLLKEIHHRVKNNLQVVVSLLNIQSDHVTDNISKEYFKISADRVRAMALIHQQLYRSSSLSHINYEFYLKDLVTHLYNLYSEKQKKINISINAKGINMTLDTAIPCGLLVNEIVTNSFKHAFPSNRNGEIKIDVRTSDGEFFLKISDDGVGLPGDIDFESEKSLGTQLIKMLTEQLEASMEIKRESGTEYIFKFKPLEYTKRL